MFADDMMQKILKSHQKSVRANKSSKVAGYKINTQKPVVSIQHPDNPTRKFKKTIPFKIASKKK